MTTVPWNDRIELAHAEDESQQLAERIKTAVRGHGCLGAVVGVSGGIDSAVTLAAAARGLGSARVLAVLLPDCDSDPVSVRLGHEVAQRCGVEAIVEDITPQLRAWGAYKARDDAARLVFADYDAQHDRLRVEFLPRLDNADAIPLFCLTIVRSDGTEQTTYMPPTPYRRIVAATNLKQRTRMTALYHVAEQRGWAVLGTANRLEIEQGFFVKHGDGAGDVFPLADYFKTQVYRLAEVLDVPQEIIDRPPTTDTYSADQTQEQFFYGLPVRDTDLIWAAYLDEIAPGRISAALGMPEPVVIKLLAAFRRRETMARLLRDAPLALNAA
jgi:NAD+ synthase